MKTTSAVYAAFALVCAFASVRTSAAGTDLPVGTLVESDVAYGDDALQKFDVYYGAAFRGAPVILMVHGGGWARGDKTNAKVVTNKVAHWVPAGYVFISVNYRLLPEADPVQQAVDVAHALAFAQRNAARWGGDPTRFVLMGHSAGAHLVALLASDPTIAARAAAVPWRGTVCLDSAAFNVVQMMHLPHAPLYDRAFGTDPEYWRAASPYLRLVHRPAPILAVCSSRRAESMWQAREFVKKVNELGGRAIQLPQDLSHGEINEQLGLPSLYTREVDWFLRSLN